LLTVTHELETIMSINIIIEDTYTRPRSGEYKNGTKFNYVQQENVYVELNHEVKKIPLRLSENQPPYTAGKYTVRAKSLLRFGPYNLEVDGFKPMELIPAQLAGIPKAA